MNLWKKITPTLNSYKRRFSRGTRCVTFSRHAIIGSMIITMVTFAENDPLPWEELQGGMSVTNVQQIVHSTLSSNDTILGQYSGATAAVIIPRLTFAHVNLSVKYFFLDNQLVQVNVSTGNIPEPEANGAFDKMARVLLDAQGLPQDHSGYNVIHEIEKRLDWQNDTYESWLMMMPTGNGSLVTMGIQFKQQE